MRQKTEWQIIDSPGNPYCMKDTEYAHLRIYKEGNGFYAEVHAGSYERIKLNPNGKWESGYFYNDIAETGGHLGGSSTPIWVSDKEIRSIDKMKSFLEEYVSNWGPIKLKERAEDYDIRRPQWIKDQMKRS